MTSRQPDSTRSVRWLPTIARLVPRADREAWAREWEAEVVFHQRSRAGTGGTIGRTGLGVVAAALQHALWLRWQSFRLETLAQDARLAFRTLIRRPAFSLAAIATLALGIGATTVIFSAMNAVFWRPLSYPDATRLVMISSATAASPAQASANSVSPPDFADWQRDGKSFGAVAAIRDDGFVLTVGDESEQISGNSVTGRFFDVLGVPAAVGRGLVDADANVGMPEVAVLGNGLWRRRFGGSTAVIGTSIVLDGTPHEIVGVMPASFDFPIGADAWVPLRFSASDLTTQRGAHYLTVVGRLRPGMATATAQTEMGALATRAAGAYPRTNKDARISVVPLRQAIVGDDAPAAMRLVFSAVVGLLLVACVNVASLLLGQALGRSRDVAVRVALGASRTRIMRTLLVESLLLALAGGVAGLGLAAAGTRSIAALTAVSIPWLDQTRLDPAVLLFAGALTVVSTCLFGVVPAWQASRRAAARDLGSTRVSEDRSRTRLGVPRFGFWRRGSRGASRRRHLRSRGGLEDPRRSCVSRPAPCSACRSPTSTLHPVAERDGQPLDQGNRIRLQVRVATPSYFRAVGIPVMNGRVFDDTDRRGGPPVAVLSEAAAQLLWPGADARGRRVLLGTRMNLGPDRLGGGSSARSVTSGRAGRPIHRRRHLVAHAPFPTGFVSFVVGRGGDVGYRGHRPVELAAVDSRVPLFRVRTLADLASRTVAQPRLFLILLGLFAVAAVALSAVGVYGVIAQNVGARRRGWSWAGARRDTARARQAVVGHADRLALSGVMAGLILAVVLDPR